MGVDSKDLAREALNGLFRRRVEAEKVYCSPCLVSTRQRGLGGAGGRAGGRRGGRVGFGTGGAGVILARVQPSRFWRWRRFLTRSPDPPPAGPTAGPPRPPPFPSLRLSPSLTLFA